MEFNYKPETTTTKRETHKQKSEDKSFIKYDTAL